MPSLLLQDIKVVNPLNRDLLVEVSSKGVRDWGGVTSEVIKLKHGNGDHSYLAHTGTVPVPDSDKVVAICIITLKVAKAMQVKSGMSSTLHIVTALNYTDPISLQDYSKHKVSKCKFPFYYYNKNLKLYVKNNIIFFYF